MLVRASRVAKADCQRGQTEEVRHEGLDRVEPRVGDGLVDEGDEDGELEEAADFAELDGGALLEDGGEDGCEGG